VVLYIEGKTFGSIHNTMYYSITSMNENLNPIVAPTTWDEDEILKYPLIFVIPNNTNTIDQIQ